LTALSTPLIRRKIDMPLDPMTARTIDHALAGKAPGRKECAYLLDLVPTSLEASSLRAAADWISRKRFNNQSILLGQIGIDSAPCPGDCQFCAFGQTHTAQLPNRMCQEEILQRARAFTQGNDLYALFLMTMHTFDFDFLLETVTAVRAAIPSHTRIVVNIGDFDAVQADLLHQSGVSGAYHVRRLREGIDTKLDPEDRMNTIETIRKAGMDWYTCCEPIGPEHSTQELVDQLFLGIDLGCFQHAAMRRVPVPKTALAKKGQISNLRLAQVVAVVTLASLACPETRTVAVHEPNLLGLVSGANSIYAEAGANPRDEEKDTENNRGMDVANCRRMLAEAGFGAVVRGDGSVDALRI
jgi:biotin synthase